MISGPRELALCLAVLALGIAGPYLFPAYTIQFATLWLMIVFAVTWDVLGGQMGYNSLGNILFFGAGMYACALTQVGMVYDVGQYTDPAGGLNAVFTAEQYYPGLILGLIVAALSGMIFAVMFGWIVFGLRGPYFAIGTLGVALAAGELVGTWEWAGGGSGIAMPVFPSTDPTAAGQFFYWLLFVLAVVTFVFFKWLYSTRFGLAINAMRDDEDKAEAMGLHTKRYKTAAWAFAAFFLGISGGIFGNMVGFIEPLEVAFPTVTFGIFMVLMALIGGKGTIWGPVLGATVFHIVKEVTWIYLLGWQWVALGLLIIVNVVYFQQGILGWARDKWPEQFGLRVDEADTAADAGAEARPGEAAQ